MPLRVRASAARLEAAARYRRESSHPCVPASATPRTSEYPPTTARVMARRGHVLLRRSSRSAARTEPDQSRARRRRVCRETPSRRACRARGSPAMAPWLGRALRWGRDREQSRGMQSRFSRCNAAYRATNPPMEIATTSTESSDRPPRDASCSPAIRTSRSRAPSIDHVSPTCTGTTTAPLPSTCRSRVATYIAASPGSPYPPTTRIGRVGAAAPAAHVSPIRAGTGDSHGKRGFSRGPTPRRRS